MPGSAARAIQVTPDGAAFDVVYDGESLGRLALRVPGLHNVRNALAAVGAGIAIGVTLDAMRPGLEGFTGVERRFQRLGEVAGVTVIDDYAHHPTEIRATLDAARAAFPRRRIVAAFQPHLYSRTRDLATEFGAALATADVVLLTEIYPAREQPIAGVTAGLIADAVTRSGRPLAWRGERSALAAALAAAVRAGDVVLTLGAGDITRTGPELLRALGGGSVGGAGGPAAAATAGRTAGMNRPAFLPDWPGLGLRGALAIAGCALLAAAAPWWGPGVLSKLAFFRVRAVEVDGAHFLAASEIVAAMRVDTTVSVWDDVRPITARVRALQEIQEASITRKLPGTLVVRVTEKAPVALIPATGDLRVYDGSGSALPIDPARIDMDLPIVNRPDRQVLRLLETIRSQTPGLFARISDVRRLASGELVMRMPDVVVRAPANVDAQRLAEVMPVTADLARRHVRVAELDLRYRDQVVARLQ